MTVPSSIADLLRLERQREELLGMRSSDFFRNAVDSWSVLKSHQSSIEEAVAAMKTADAATDYRRMLSPQQDFHIQDAAAAAFMMRADSLYERSFVKQALEAADLVNSMSLPSALDAFRPTRDLLASQLLTLDRPLWWNDSLYLNSFATTSAFARLLVSSPAVTDQVTLASHAFLSNNLLSFGSLGQYRQFLDAAGLILPRWPIVRCVNAVVAKNVDCFTKH